MRKELRAVKAGLESDIKSLGMWIKVINILLVPLLFAGLALLVALVASPPPARHRHAAQRSLGMMRKRSLTLAAAAAVLLIAGLWLSLHRASEQADLGGGKVFADLTPALGEVTEIRLSKGDGSRTTLRKAAQRLDRGRARISRRFRPGARPGAGPRRHEVRRTQDQRSGELRKTRRRGARHADRHQHAGRSGRRRQAAGRSSSARMPRDAPSTRASRRKRPVRWSQPAISVEPDPKRWIDRAAQRYPRRHRARHFGETRRRAGLSTDAREAR